MAEQKYDPLSQFFKYGGASQQVPFVLNMGDNNLWQVFRRLEGPSACPIPASLCQLSIGMLVFCWQSSLETLPLLLLPSSQTP
jgi:hypothetical protein